MFPVSESHACTPLILLIIEMDVSLIAGFHRGAWLSKLTEAAGGRGGASYSVSPGTAQVRKKMSFFISTFRAV